jgi:hypothetical protein
MRIFKNRTPKARREKVRPLMLELKSKGYYGLSAYERFKSLGIAYRKADFLKDWVANVASKKEES